MTVTTVGTITTEALDTSPPGGGGGRAAMKKIVLHGPSLYRRGNQEEELCPLIDLIACKGWYRRQLDLTVIDLD